MRTRSAVLPGTEGGFANLIGGTTQARRGTGIDVSVPDSVPCGAGAIAEVVEIGVSNRLTSPTAAIRIIKGRVANVSAGTGLGKCHTGNEQEKNEEHHGAPLLRMD
jgi:hypothetical protein